MRSGKPVERQPCSEQEGNWQTQHQRITCGIQASVKNHVIPITHTLFYSKIVSEPIGDRD